jgi:predicted metal-dependent peptidase
MATKLTDPFDALESAAKKQQNEDEAARAISAARSTLVLDRTSKGAFFATLAMSLKTQPDWTIDTACTDGKTLKYNPEFICGLPAKQQIGLLCHEVLHCANKHQARMGVREPRRWNIACDLAVNHILATTGYELPPGRLLPGQGEFKSLPAGLSAEDYYGRLPDQPQSPDGDGDQAGGNDPGGCGGVEPAGNGSQADAQESAAEWDVKVMQAGEAAKRRGDVPGELARMIGEIASPKVDWRAVLREFVTIHARNDYAWNPPNRRFLWLGIYLPGMRSEELGEIVVAVDTSGSIGAKELRVFGSEMQGILDSYDCELTILYHDSKVAGVQKWKSTDGPLVLEPRGGGGTNHCPVFEHIEDHGLNPTCLVCLTDMESCFPSKGPSYPVLWVSTQDSKKAPFGSLVTMEV